MLFTGTVRTNLDPTGTLEAAGVADGDVWELLREVGLRKVVKGLGGLDGQLPTGGSGLALGQRQLFSLVRCARARAPGCGRLAGFDRALTMV